MITHAHLKTLHFVMFHSYVNSGESRANFKNGTKMEALLNMDVSKSNFFKTKSDYVVTPIPPKRAAINIQEIDISFQNLWICYIQFLRRKNERAGIIFWIQYSVNWDRMMMMMMIQIWRKKTFHNCTISWQLLFRENPRLAFLLLTDSMICELHIFFSYAHF